MRICLYVQGKLKNDAHIDTSISSDDGLLSCRVTTREQEKEEEEDEDEERESAKEKGATAWIDHCRWLIFSRHLTLHITNILFFLFVLLLHLINHSIGFSVFACFLSVSIQPETIECHRHKQI
jgi:hypothetical protein